MESYTILMRVLGVSSIMQPFQLNRSTTKIILCSSMDTMALAIMAFLTMKRLDLAIIVMKMENGDFLHFILHHENML